MSGIFVPPWPEPLKPIVKVMLAIWFVLLIPWPLFFMTTGMAFEGNYQTAEAYTFVWSVWAYPVLVAGSWYWRRKQPQLIWLPLLTFAGLGVSALLHKSY